MLQQDDSKPNPTYLISTFKVQPKRHFAKQNNCGTGANPTNTQRMFKGQQVTLFVTFIDIKKAFDSVHRDRMFDILTACGISKLKLLDTIRLSNSYACAIVKFTTDGMSTAMVNTSSLSLRIVLDRLTAN